MTLPRFAEIVAARTEMNEMIKETSKLLANRLTTRKARNLANSQVVEWSQERSLEINEYLTAFRTARAARRAS